MTALAISRISPLLRSYPTSDHNNIHVIRKFQIFAGLYAGYRRPKADIGVEIIDDGLPKDYRLQVLKVGSRRLDSIVCRAIGQGRGFVFLHLFLLFRHFL